MSPGEETTENRFGEAIFQGVIRKLGIGRKGKIEQLPAPDNMVVGPFYSNRSARRSSGERGYSHGLGAMATSIRQRRR